MLGDTTDKGSRQPFFKTSPVGGINRPTSHIVRIV